MPSMGEERGIEAPGVGNVTLRIYSPTAEQALVSAAVYAAKLNALIFALRAADRAVNGNKLHYDYGIVRMQSSAPTTTIGQYPLPRSRSSMFTRAPVEAFEECVEDILAGRDARALQFGQCPKYVARLASGSPKQFAYGELWIENRVVRIDAFMAERARSFLPSPIEIPVPQIMDTRDWYKGEAFGSYVGNVEYIDARGELPEIKLILSGGEKYIDCVCQKDHMAIIGSSLKRKVRVHGKAIYDGATGLPRRIYVHTIDPIPEATDLSVWRGSFKPFELDSWEGDGE